MKSKQIALCGLLTALAVVSMVLCAAIGIGTFLGPILAMIVLLPILEEYGIKLAAAAYTTTALLGLLIVPEFELAMVYTAFGWYPILRPGLNRVSSRLLRLAVKLLLCTAVILFLYGVVLRMLGITAELLDAAPLFNAALLLLGDFTFLVTDKALARLSFLWQVRFRKYLFH